MLIIPNKELDLVFGYIPPNIAMDGLTIELDVTLINVSSDEWSG